MKRLAQATVVALGVALMAASPAAANGAVSTNDNVGRDTGPLSDAARFGQTADGSRNSRRSPFMVELGRTAAAGRFTPFFGSTGASRPVEATEPVAALSLAIGLLALRYWYRRR